VGDERMLSDKEEIGIGENWTRLTSWLKPDQQPTGRTRDRLTRTDNSERTARNRQRTRQRASLRSGSVDPKYLCPRTGEAMN
jgi:hypothetical protein